MLDGAEEEHAARPQAEGPQPEQELPSMPEAAPARQHIGAEGRLLQLRLAYAGEKRRAQLAEKALQKSMNQAVDHAKILDEMQERLAELLSAFAGERRRAEIAEKALLDNLKQPVTHWERPADAAAFHTMEAHQALKVRGMLDTLQVAKRASGLAGDEGNEQVRELQQQLLTEQSLRYEAERGLFEKEVQLEALRQQLAEERAARAEDVGSDVQAHKYNTQLRLKEETIHAEVAAGGLKNEHKSAVQPSQHMANQEWKEVTARFMKNMEIHCAHHQSVDELIKRTVAHTQVLDDMMQAADVDEASRQRAAPRAYDAIQAECSLRKSQELLGCFEQMGESDSKKSPLPLPAKEENSASEKHSPHRAQSVSAPSSFRPSFVALVPLAQVAVQSWSSRRVIESFPASPSQTAPFRVTVSCNAYAGHSADPHHAQGVAACPSSPVPTSFLMPRPQIGSLGPAVVPATSDGGRGFSPVSKFDPNRTRMTLFREQTAP